MTTALVTGAAGTIGRHLCQELQARGWKVLGLVRKSQASGPWEKSIEGDVAERETVLRHLDLLRGEEVDVVFHLASKAHALSELSQDDEEYFRVNTVGTENLLTLAQEIGVRRFILASSVKAMGEGEAFALDEEAACAPETPYGKSKFEAEKRVLEPHGSMEMSILRLTMVYGMAGKGNMERMVAAIKAGRFPPFPETGNRRTMVYMDDVVDAFLLAATHPRAVGETFIVTDGHHYSTRELYLAIRRALGKTSDPLWTPPIALYRSAAKCGDVAGRVLGRRVPLDSDTLAKLTNSAAYSSRKMTEMLGYEPKWSLNDALEKIVEGNGR